MKLFIVEPREGIFRILLVRPVCAGARNVLEKSEDAGRGEAATNSDETAAKARLVRDLGDEFSSKN